MPSKPDYPQALQLALQGIVPLNQFETVPLDDAPGRILAESIAADRDLPPFNRAQMDGYAVRAADIGRVKSFRVAGAIHAGSSHSPALGPGECAAIATGAPLPPDADSVVPHESSDRADPVTFTIQSLKAGSAVHPRAADAKKGDVVLRAGAILAPHHLGIAAAVGRAKLLVAQRPRVAILTSGDEVVPIEHEPRPHQIRNSNAVLIRSLLAKMGACPISHQHLPDDAEATIAAVGQSLADADIVVTIGGISAGERDHFHGAFQKHGVRTNLKGAALQPGGPVFVGRAAAGQTIIGLPGNPVSVLACACLFAWPIVRVLLGLSADLPWREARLMEPVKPNATRRAFRPAKITPEGGIIVPTWAGSGDLVHTAATHGLAELPIQTDEVPVGTALRFLPWP